MDRRRSSPPLAAALVAVGTAALAATAPARAQTCSTDPVEDGDVLVSDLTGNRLLRVTDVGALADPDDNQEEVCSGGDVLFPRDVVPDRRGRLFVSMNDAVVRVAPEDDAQTRVFQDPPLLTPPRGIDKVRDGNLFLAYPSLDFPEVYVVDPVTGANGPICSAGCLQALIGFPLGLILDPRNDPDDRTLLIADSGAVATGIAPGIRSLDALSLDVDTISEGGSLTVPYRLAADGDDVLYVSDLGDSLTPPRVVRIDRTADPQDNQQVVAEGGHLITPVGIAVDALGRVFVVDADAEGGALVEIRPDDFTPADLEGNQRIVSRGQLFDNPWGLEIVAPGTIAEFVSAPFFVTDADPGDPSRTGVFRIDPDGTRTAIATGAPFLRPAGIAVDPSDTDFLLVADPDAGALFRLEKTPGSAPQTVAQGGELAEPVDVMVDADGRYVITDRLLQGLVRVDPPASATPGAQEVLTRGCLLENPTAASFTPSGRILVAEPGGPLEPEGRLVLVNPFTPESFPRQQTLFRQGDQGDVVLDGLAGLALDTDDSSTVLSIAATDPDPSVARFLDVSNSFLAVSASTEYGQARGIAIEDSRDVVGVDAATGNDDGRLLRLDPTEQEPAVVSGSEGLHDPWGVAIDGVPRRAPPFADDDTDGDGVNDDDDNCVLNPNPEQANSDADPRGDVCSALCDFDGDTVVQVSDFIVWAEESGREDCSDLDPCLADCDDDDRVQVSDFTAWKNELNYRSDGPVGSLVGAPPTCLEP